MEADQTQELRHKHREPDSAYSITYNAWRGGGGKAAYARAHSDILEFWHNRVVVNDFATEKYDCQVELDAWQVIGRRSFWRRK